MAIYNINRDYLVSVNLKNAQVTSSSMNFYNTDKGIANIFVKLQVAMSQDLDIKQYVSMQSASNYRVKLLAIKPKTKAIVELDGVLMNPSVDGNNAVYLFDMPSNFTDQVGDYACELEVICDVNNLEEVVTSNPFAYKVNPSVATNLNFEIEASPDLPILKQLIKEVEINKEWIPIVDDLTPTQFKTYSSKKIEELKKNIDEQFNTKANKNEIWSMANMGQDVKEAMTNGSVAVIGKASVLTETIVSEQVKYFSTNFLKCGKNLFNKKDIIKGIYIRHDNETIVQNSSYLCSNYIRVEKNTDYYISNCRFIAFYDSSFKYINPGVESPDKAGITFNTGNAEYIRVTLSDSANFLDRCQLEKGTTKTTYEDYYEYFPNVKVTNNNIKDLNLNLSLLSGKTLINAGDSIAYGSGNNGVGYAEIIATKYNMNFYDYSNGGATIGVTEDNNILTQIENAISNGITPDYFIFNGGTNDINTGAVVPLGELTEKYSGITYDTSTFTGGFEQICKLIRNTWPKCKILYVRVHNMASRDISLQKQYGERAKEICEKWSIPYVDLFSEGQLNTNIIIMQQFTNNSDKTHPNSEGYELYYVPLIENKLLHI